MPPSKYCNVTVPETLLHKKKAVAYPVQYTCIHLFIRLISVPSIEARVFSNLAQNLISGSVF